jgi:hypothetical protein
VTLVVKISEGSVCHCVFSADALPDNLGFAQRPAAAHMKEGVRNFGSAAMMVEGGFRRRFN